MATGQSSRPRAARGSTSDDGALDPALPQKKRARHRLIGAIALCALAAALLPLVLESEPGRRESELAIHIPSRDTPARGAEPHASGTIAPAAAPEAAVADAPAANGTAPASPSAAPVSPVAPPVAPVAPPAPARAGAPADPKPPANSKVPVDPKAPARPADAKPADAKSAQAPGTARYLIQVGAFSSEASAKQVVDRVQAAGLSAFTERIKTDSGDRIRVRVGPFGSREVAEQARERLKASGMEAALIAP